MDILLNDLSTKSYKEIKEEVDKVDTLKIYKNHEFEIIVNNLIKDKRKNVQSLGNRLIKEKNKIQDEIIRVKSMYSFDKSFGNYNYIAGVDEVGRGPLAGPIVSCAVILDLNCLDDDLILWINDSKKINEKKREELAEVIKEKAIAYNIGLCTNNDIDERGIGVCNNDVFLQACYGLEVKPDFILSDGYTIKNVTIKNEAVIKGDTKSACIAAASIVAKVFRDNLMKEYSKTFDKYAFEENMGYGTSKHISGLKENGPCEIHRLSFLNNILNS